MVNWWVQSALEMGGYVFLLSWVVWVILSICLHELAHGWAALDQGDDTPRALGHMTLNPLVHMGKMSLLMFALVGIAWGAMPVSPSHFRQGTIGEAKVAAAGPAMNLLLALICLTLLGVVESLVPGGAALLDHLKQFLWVGGLLNITLMIFNLLPILPLDGSKIAAALSPDLRRLYFHENAPRFSLMLLLVLFFFGGQYLFVIAAEASHWWTSLIVRIV